jgi:hypothetical protein
MADQLIVSQITAEAEYDDETPRLIVSQLSAETEYDDESPRLIVTQLSCEVEYEEGSTPVTDAFIAGSPRVPVAMATIETPFGTYRSATCFYVDTNGHAYLAGLEYPTITSELRDQFSGVSSTGSLTIKIAIGRGGLSTDVSFKTLAETNDFRDCWISIYTYDPVTGENIDGDIGFRGRIDSFEWDDLYIYFNTTTGSDPSLEKMLPPDTVTVERYYPTAIDIGVPLNMPFGICHKIPCPNIRNDWGNDAFWYHISYSGIESVDQVYRDDWPVPSSEWTLVHGLFDDYITFSHEQRNYTGQMAKITADVHGFKPRYKIDMILNGGIYFMSASTEPSAHHVLDVVKMMYTHPSSINDSMGVDEAAFAAAKTALGDEATLWLTSINIGGTQKKAGDWLNDILAYMPIHIERDYRGRVYPVVDGAAPTTIHTMGFRDGFYDNCEVTKRGISKSSESIKSVRLSYNFNEIALDKYGRQIRDAYHYEIFAPTGKTNGTDKAIQHVAMNDTPSAKKLLSRIIGRAKYSDRSAIVRCGPEYKEAVSGDLFKIYTSYPGTYEEYIVKKQTKNFRDVFEFECKKYDAGIYDDLTIADPLEPEDTSPSVSGPEAIPYNYKHVDGSVYATELTPAETARYVFGGLQNGIPTTADWVLLCHKVTQTVTFPVGLTGSSIFVSPDKTGSAATAETTLLIKKYTASTSSFSTIGSAIFAAAGMVGAFTFTTEQTLIAGDVFYLVGPSTPDATLGDFSYTFLGVKESSWVG